MTPRVNPPPPPQRPSGPPKPPARPQPANLRAEATFNSALERPAGERAAHLVQVCGDDDALHAEVIALLKAHEAAEDIMPDDAPLSPEAEAEMARLKPRKAAR